MNFFLKITLALWFFTQLVQAQTQRLKIGANPTTINPSAALEIESTTSGFLPPRITATQMNAITSPTEGLLVYCSDCTAKGVYVYTGTAWDQLMSVSSSQGSVPTLAADCNSNGISGSFVASVSGTRSFTVLITNNSFTTATVAFQNSDVVLSGVAGLSVTTTSPASLTLSAGQSDLVTYTITGTPEDAGTLTAEWSKVGLSCTKTVTVKGNAVFALPQSKMVASSSESEGSITNTSPNQIIVNIPYTGGLGTYPAYTGSVVTGAPGEGGDLKGFSISYPAGTFGTSGSIPVTITVDGDGSYRVKQKQIGEQETIVTLPFVFNGESKGSIVLKALGGILDRAFGQTINGADNHNFVYLPIVAADGNTWLNNNLGAHYANKEHASFDPMQQATSATDHLAYGSLFQWGRGADGHELMSYTSGTTGTAVNGTTSTNADSPDNALFIVESSSPYDWRVSQDDTLWATEASANNPCPVGYKVPTNAQLATLFTTSNIINTDTAASSVMKLPASGSRYNANGSIVNLGTSGLYWSSSASGSYAINRYFTSVSTNTISDNRAYGSSVRCIKN